MKYYAEYDILGNIIGYHTGEGDMTLPRRVVELTQDQYVACQRYSGRYVVRDGALMASSAAPVTDPLVLAKSVKLSELADDAAATEAAGFVSSALGRPLTYPSDQRAQMRMAGVLAQINDPKVGVPEPITWFTKEEGYLPHTDDQFRQLCKDGTVFIAANARKLGTKEYFVNGAKTVKQVDDIMWLDAQPPSVPTGLAVSNPDSVRGYVLVSWNPDPEGDVLGYNLFMDGAQVNADPIQNIKYEISGLVSQSSHVFCVSAMDGDGNESAKSANLAVVIL